MKPGTSIFYSLLVSANAASVLADGSPFDSWTHSDLKNYVKDQQKSLEKLNSKTFEELKVTLSEAWPSYSGGDKPWWQFWPSQSSIVGSSQPVYDWLFETWPAEKLHGFLKKHGIKSGARASKGQLVSDIKKNFGSISEKLDTSGYYPSSFYFEHWTPEDFKSWLDEFTVPYQEGIDELSDKVRENIYRVSKAAEGKRFSTLKSLDLSNKDLLDSAGDIKEKVFEDWSTEDLKRWLDSHKIAYSDKIEDKREELAALATEQRELLKDDIQWFLETAQRRSSPFLTKSPEYVSSLWERTMLNLGGAFGTIQEKVGDVINDTFLIDLENWPRDRITEFLDARSVGYSSTATIEQLRGLAREFRNRPLKKAQEKYEQFADGQWYYDLKSWVQERSDEVQKSEAYKSLSANAKTLGKNTQDWGSSLGKKVKDDFNSWSTEDLKSYLKKLGTSVSSATMSKEDLVKLVREKTNLGLGVQRQPWYEKWTNNAKNLLSRVSALIVRN